MTPAAENLTRALRDKSPIPGIHDALSARLAEDTGYAACFLEIEPMALCRYGVRSLDSLGAGDILSAVSDIAGAVRLPILVEAPLSDGDQKNAARFVFELARLGAAGVLISDLDDERHRAAKVAAASEGLVSLLKMTADRITSATEVDFRQVDGVCLIGEAPQLDRLRRLLQDRPLGCLADNPTLPSAVSAACDFSLHSQCAVANLESVYAAFLDDLRQGRIPTGDAVGFEAWKEMMHFSQWADWETCGEG